MYPVRDWNPDSIPITVSNGLVVTAKNARDPILPQPNDSFVEITAVYLNGLGYPVTVLLRDGMDVTIPPMGSRVATRQFIVRVRYRFSRHVKVNVHRLLHAVEQEDASAKAIMDGLRAADAVMNIYGTDLVLERTMDAKVLESNGGSIYLADLDIALRYVDDSVTIHHPCRPMAKSILASRNNNQPGFDLRIEINDPKQRFGDRFTVMRGTLVRIKPINDPSRAEGVYAWMNGQETLDMSSGDYKYYSFEDAERELRLFDSAAKAKANGEEADQRRNELEQEQHKQRMEVLHLESEIRRITHDNEVELSKYKQLKVELDAKVTEELARIKRREAELDEEAKRRERERDIAFAEEKVRREVRMMADKEYYERRSYDRKDSSEIVKWIPAAALGLGMILSKFF